jgi:hypothetical protein
VTLTPSFRDFLPAWVAGQPWYAGTGVPRLALVGQVRMEDPDGEVGIEAHLVSDGSATYQVPMTYRGAPLDRSDGLIARAEHSELGTRWIYDGPADPVWVREVRRLVETEGTSAPGTATARGHRLAAGDLSAARIDIVRTLTPTPPPSADALGVVLGEWTGGSGSMIMFLPPG